jgi:hypothetical protein
MSTNYIPPTGGFEGPPMLKPDAWPHDTSISGETVSSFGVVVSDYEKEGFRSTDRQFSVAAGHTERADLVHPLSKQRILVSRKSDPNSDTVVRNVLGPHSTLEQVADNGDFSAYRLPRGTRLLISAVESQAYQPEYTRLLVARTALLEYFTIRMGIEPEIGPNDIAITHNGGGNDDVHLTILPPIKIDHEMNRRSHSEIKRIIKNLGTGTSGYLNVLNRIPKGELRGGLKTAIDFLNE